MNSSTETGLNHALTDYLRMNISFIQVRASIVPKLKLESIFKKFVQVETSAVHRGSFYQNFHSSLPI